MPATELARAPPPHFSLASAAEAQSRWSSRILLARALMYTLLVSHQASDQDSGEFLLDRTRFLEYTDRALAEQLSGLAVEAIAALLSWPALVMDEGRGEEPAFLRRVSSIRVKDRNLGIHIGDLPGAPSLTNDAVWRLRDALDIGEFEFSRNHLAVKQRDLFAVLREAGHTIAPEVASSFSELPSPLPSRSLLLSAKDALGSLGHTDLDDLLLEAGIDGMPGDRSLGSRQNRAIAIVRYALEHPGAVTAERSLLGPFLIRKAGLASEVAVRDQPTARRPLVAQSADGRAASAAELPGRSPNRVFVVHGQDDTARAELVDFLRSIGLDPIVLHDQPNMGRHLLTKFIDEAELVTFAVVLMTADDEGRRAGASELRMRARQNVILELGYFLAHLGQPRVCALVTPGLETPSDFDGIVYIQMKSTGRWKNELERELRAADMPLASRTRSD